MKSKKNIILAMETAIEGGSLSISDGASEIDFWTGKNDISKAEDILEAIDGLLKKNNISGGNISNIAVSTGVGSATGLKIGLATAKGLSKAFGCPTVEISLWDALASDANLGTEQNALAFLPHGKGAVCFREMKNQQMLAETEILSKQDFREKSEHYFELNIAIYAHPQIISANQLNHYPFHILSKSLASYITNARLIIN